MNVFPPLFSQEEDNNKGFLTFNELPFDGVWNNPQRPNWLYDTADMNTEGLATTQHACVTYGRLSAQ